MLGAKVSIQDRVIVIDSNGTNVRNSIAHNTNNVYLRNTQGSAIALQSNLVELAGPGAGHDGSVTAISTNHAAINNAAGVGTVGSGTSADNNVATPDDLNSSQSAVSASQSAVAIQSNLVAISGLDGHRPNHVFNTNWATIINKGNTAVTLQQNMAVISLPAGKDTGGDTVTNLNIATVNNRVTGNTGGVNASLRTDSQGISNDTATGTVAVQDAAVAVQTNLACILGAGTLRNDHLRNDNQVVLTDIGNSSVAGQGNIVQLLASTDGRNLSNNIVNSNDARVSNRVVGVQAQVMTEAALDSILFALAASNSSVASQYNSATITGGGDAIGNRISNSNNARVLQSLK